VSVDSREDRPVLTRELRGGCGAERIRGGSRGDVMGGGNITGNDITGNNVTGNGITGNDVIGNE